LAPLGDEAVVDLAFSPGPASADPVERATEVLANWLGDDSVRGGLPWLAAAVASAGLACEIARRQLRPARGGQVPPPELPDGWFLGRP
jgi:hypothetical protein